MAKSDHKENKPIAGAIVAGVLGALFVLIGAASLSNLIEYNGASLLHLYMTNIYKFLFGMGVIFAVMAQITVARFLTYSKLMHNEKVQLIETLEPLTSVALILVAVGSLLTIHLLWWHMLWTVCFVLITLFMDVWVWVFRPTKGGPLCEVCRSLVFKVDGVSAVAIGSLMLLGYLMQDRFSLNNIYCNTSDNERLPCIVDSMQALNVFYSGAIGLHLIVITMVLASLLYDWKKLLPSRSPIREIGEAA